jgi:signal recognition particle subunit SRP54
MGDIVSLVEKAKEKIDEEESAKMAERMMNGQFSMDDLLKQFEMIERMGPLGGIMKMIPGMNQYAGMMDEAKTGSAMKQTKAIIQSMTKEERAHPEKIRSTMKRRIAKGSGTSVDSVNKLLNQFNRTKKSIDQLGMMQKNGSLNEEKLQQMADNMQNMKMPEMPKNGFRRH